MSITSEDPAPRGSVIKRIGTRKREAAYDVFKNVYGSRFDADFAKGSGDFSLNFAIAAMDRVILLKADVADYDCARESESSLQIFVPLSGTLIQKCGMHGDALEGNPKTATVVRPFERTRHIVQKGSALVLTLQIADVISRIETLMGRSVSADLNSELVASADLSAPAAAAFARNMKLAFAELASLERISLTSLVQSSYQDLLANLALPVLVPWVMKAIERPGENCGSSVTRKARDYIVEHATDVIELTKLAALLGISMRTLQINFQKHYGFSPRDYIIECRLDLARKLLMSGNAGRSVTEIGFECGFSNLGHFAAKYRDKFGELPSETLKLSNA